MIQNWLISLLLDWNSVCYVAVHTVRALLAYILNTVRRTSFMQPWILHFFRLIDITRSINRLNWTPGDSCSNYIITIQKDNSNTFNHFSHFLASNKLSVGHIPPCVSNFWTWRHFHWRSSQMISGWNHISFSRSLIPCSSPTSMPMKPHRKTFTFRVHVLALKKLNVDFN